MTGDPYNPDAREVWERRLDIDDETRGRIRSVLLEAEIPSRIVDPLIKPRPESQRSVERPVLHRRSR